MCTSCFPRSADCELGNSSQALLAPDGEFLTAGVCGAEQVTAQMTFFFSLLRRLEWMDLLKRCRDITVFFEPERTHMHGWLPVNSLTPFVLMWLTGGLGFSVITALSCLLHGRWSSTAQHQVAVTTASRLTVNHTIMAVLKWPNVISQWVQVRRRKQEHKKCVCVRVGVFLYIKCTQTTSFVILFSDWSCCVSSRVTLTVNVFNLRVSSFIFPPSCILHIIVLWL